MRRQVSVTLFPFLSVLLATMGILAFLAVTFLLFARPEMAPPEQVEPIAVRWVGAPEYVRPLLLECRGAEARFRSPRASGETRYTREELQREVEIVRELYTRGRKEAGVNADRYRIWFMMKSLIQNDRRLGGSLTMALHELEVSNIRGRSVRRDNAYFPILLVYSDGIEIYELVSYLVETTTQFPIGLEPMLKGWELPYTDLSS